MSQATTVARCGARTTAEFRLRGFIAPLTVALALVTASALLIVAATLAPPTTGAHASSPATPPDGTALPVATATTLLRADGVTLPPSPVVLELARLIYAPDSGGPSRALPGPLIVVVEAGSLDADCTGTALVRRADGTTAIDTGAVALHAGDRLTLPASTEAGFRNDDATPALLLAAGVFPARIIPATVAQQRLIATTTPSRWDDYWSPGATIQSLAGGWLMDAPAGPTTLDLRRLVLAPGASVPAATSGGMAIGVEAGALTLMLARGIAWVQTPHGPDNELLADAGAATLLPGDGTLIPSAASAMLRNDGSGPLLAIVLTVAPAVPGNPAGTT
jgi:hypothetical protein